MALDDIIEKHALKNAHDYGKANPGSVIGKVIAELPDAKKEMKSLVAKVQETVKKVNKMSKEDIEAAMERYTYAEKGKAERALHVPGLAERVAAVTRFAPEPSGYLHVGHAKAALLSSEIARQSGGEIHLRFDDTNPDKARQEYVDAVKRDLNWLNVGWRSESYASDSMELLYEYGTEMIKRGKAYICECTPEAIRLSRRERKGCACRERPLIDNLRNYERMLKGEFEEGKAIVRFFGEPRALNSVMRDPTLFRICSTPHYRQGDKYLVWPSYDFECPILDSVKGITHALRSKEYELRDELYRDILNILELPRPEIITISRLEVKDNTTSKRVIKDLVQKRLIKSWDDPRLLTISALRRRGILPEAIREFVLSFGMGKAESVAELEQLLIENRKLLDPVAKRFHFVRNPVRVRISNIKDEDVRLRLHPTQDLGERTARIVGGVVYIDAGDRPAKDEIVRLKDFCTIKVIDFKDRDIIAERIETEAIPEKKIQWVGDNRTWARIHRPGDLLKGGEFNPDSLVVEEGICEKDCESLKDGEVMQFVRYGFVRKEGVEDGKLKFIFSC